MRAGTLTMRRRRLLRGRGEGAVGEVAAARRGGCGSSLQMAQAGGGNRPEGQVKKGRR